MTEYAVRTEDLWKIYPQEPRPVEAVRGVDLEVRAGEFVAMAGPSGSGKTTVLNLLGGLTRPTRGKVWIRDSELSELPDKELAAVRLTHIGFVFQSYNLLPVLSALENAEFTLLLQGVPARERRERVRRLFREIGLEGLEDRTAAEAVRRAAAARRGGAGGPGRSGIGARGRAHGESGFDHGRGASRRDGAAQPRKGDHLRLLDP